MNRAQCRAGTKYRCIDGPLADGILYLTSPSTLPIKKDGKVGRYVGGEYDSKSETWRKTLVPQPSYLIWEEQL